MYVTINCLQFLLKQFLTIENQFISNKYSLFFIFFEEIDVWLIQTPPTNWKVTALDFL